MCKFFSFCTDGKTNRYYFNNEQRMNLKKDNPQKYETDSHASICKFYGLNEDKVNKYEFDPFWGGFTVDQINAKNDDRKLAEKWVRKLTIPYSFVSGYLDLSGCDLKGITLPQSVGGYLDLIGCDLKGITLPQSVGGSLDLSGCDLNGITLPQSVGGYLDLSGCDLKGITLPQSIGGSLYLSGCDMNGITIPDRFKNKIIR